MAGSIKKILAVLLAAALLAGCGEGAGISETESRTAGTQDSGRKEQEGIQKEQEEAQKESQETQDAGKEPGDAGGADWLYAGTRPVFWEQKGEAAAHVTPSVERWMIAPDLGNVENTWQFYITPGMQEKLVQNGFVVADSAGSEFFDIYETNRYAMIPNFITVDSLMHTYHLFFAEILKNTEKEYLAEKLKELSVRMLQNSRAQYEALAGSEWEEAAKRNTVFFTVGAKLLDDSILGDGTTDAAVSEELSKIGRAEGIEVSAVTGKEEDYSQYKPRSYYAGDETLERYFKAMMWYGRIHFEQREEELDRSALLITKALADDPDALRLWKRIYAVTSFFAGTSDDAGVCEYAPVMEAVYGRSFTVGELAGNGQAFAAFHERTASLRAPAVNSVPVQDGKENVIPGFRFLGQRFTVDAAVMQKLIYSSVGENGAGQKRMLPDVLDVPAALGSDKALELLEDAGAAEFEGYSENMESLRDIFGEEKDALWTQSLYAGWLNTLRPLLLPKGEGYPVFMQNEEWVKKDLECFAGSYTELKHDTVLYSKQSMAEMGGGWDEEPDDRGYVQPEPVVYERFAALAEQTLEGLSRFGMLSPSAQSDLEQLKTMADTLMVISNKELAEEALTDEEYEFIRSYGGYLEHFWYGIASKEAGVDEETYIESAEYPAAVVVDLATDPNGTVLEAATGQPSMIYVVVKVDGKLKLARGSVYSFYQFPWALDDRLTDTKWRQMMGFELGEDGSYRTDSGISQPGWTQSYRSDFAYE